MISKLKGLIISAIVLSLAFFSSSSKALAGENYWDYSYDENSYDYSDYDHKDYDKEKYDHKDYKDYSYQDHYQDYDNKDHGDYDHKDYSKHEDKNYDHVYTYGGFKDVHELWTWLINLLSQVFGKDLSGWQYV